MQTVCVIGIGHEINGFNSAKWSGLSKNMSDWKEGWSNTLANVVTVLILNPKSVVIDEEVISLAFNPPYSKGKIGFKNFRHSKSDSP